VSTRFPVLQVGDVGTIIDLYFVDSDTEAPIDLTTATAVEIHLKNNALTTVVEDAEIVGSPTLGHARTTCALGLLAEAGTLFIQGKAVFPGGSWRTALATVQVGRAL